MKIKSAHYVPTVAKIVAIVLIYILAASIENVLMT